MDDENATFYLEHGSRLLLESSQPVECELIEGDIIEASDQHGREVFLTQEDKVQKYTSITGKLNDTDLVSLGVSIESAFSYSSFDKSGLYDPSFIEARKDYLFRGDLYHDMTRKVTMSFFHDTKAWKDKRNQNLNFLEYLNPDSLVDTVLGHWLIRFIKDFLGYVSYVASIWFLITVVRYIRDQYKKHTRVSNFVKDVDIEAARKQQSYRLSTLQQRLHDPTLKYD